MQCPHLSHRMRSSDQWGPKNHRLKTFMPVDATLAPRPNTPPSKSDGRVGVRGDVRPPEGQIKTWTLLGWLVRTSETCKWTFIYLRLQQPRTIRLRRELKRKSEEMKSASSFIKGRTCHTRDICPSVKSTSRFSNIARISSSFLLAALALLPPKRRKRKNCRWSFSAMRSALPRGPCPCGLGRKAERREGVVMAGLENMSWSRDGGHAVRLEMCSCRYARHGLDILV